jgi:hypothetical protein
MFKWLVLFLTLSAPAAAQQVTCATRPTTDNSNACASTAWVVAYFPSVTVNISQITGLGTNVLSSLTIPTYATTPASGALLTGADFAAPRNITGAWTFGGFYPITINLTLTCDGGATNQASTLNTQLNAAPANSVIEFPRNACTIGVNGAVVNDAVSGHIIHGNGATLKKLSAGDAFTLSGAGVIVDHLTENGNSYGNSGFTLTSTATGSGFYNSFVNNNGGNGVSFVNNVDGFFINGGATNNTLIGVSIYQGNAQIVTGNFISYSGAEGITFDGNASPAYTGTVNSIIQQNSLTNNGQNGCFGGIGGGNNSNNNNVSNNTVLGTVKCPGIAINGQGNIANSNRTSGNGAPGGSGTATGIWLSHVASATNSNNMLDGNVEDETYGINIDSTVEGNQWVGANGGTLYDPGNKALIAFPATKITGAGNSEVLDVVDKTSTHYFAIKPETSSGIGSIVYWTGSNSPIYMPGPIGASQGYTVSTLNSTFACSATYQGFVAYVTDANAPTYGATLSGSGTTKTLAFCDGSAWKAH